MAAETHRSSDIIVRSDENLIGRDGFLLGGGPGSERHVEVFTEIREE